MMTTQMAPNLEMLAAIHGITITTHTGGEKGRWHSDTRTISLRKDLHPTLRYCTLAHELGHALNNHDSRTEAWLRGRQEREADIFAANVLIDPTEYKNAELLYGPHPGAIAQELGVTNHLVTVWRNTHHTATSHT
ncbi:ImmA/IrrE family metallo-endopeptidase [Corynebacterium pseudokroppenstedtii]|uniref:ImmA/IrrE family metallo-endopeptidase n=2 Tax=Corynebacterium pseudokroppenstedtii TaxID=2804917 RepID=A0AAU0PYR0_9CORY|nr:ImmA/IrrE family metallo-endopeptidase [Corynebacterium pseudokroppenstedtii]